MSGKFGYSIRTNRDFVRQETIGYQSISKLNAEQWVNDEIINGYVNLLRSNSKPRFLVLNTFFYALLSRKGVITSEKIFACVSYSSAANISITLY
jgi:Ulp1 family protease